MAAQTIPAVDAAPRPRDGANDAGMSCVPFHQLAWPQPLPGAPSPLLCAAWADALAAYWLHQRGSGALDAGEPLFVCDLAPRDGALAAGLLNILAPWLAEGGWPPLRYILQTESAAEADVLLSHPALATHAASGVLTTRLPPQAAHPIVMVAWHYFSALPSELHAVHYGAAMSATLTVEPGTGELTYDWFDRVPAPAEDLRDLLLAHYTGRCNTSCVLLPVAAADAIARIADLSGGRYLLLAADYGVSKERQIRMNAWTPPAQWPAAGPLPHNAHALALALRARGAACWLHQINEGGQVQHAAWRDGPAPPDTAGFSAVQQALSRAHPDDSPQMAILAAAWTSGQAWALAPPLLRQNDYDPAILRACLPALLSGYGCEAGCWRHAVEEVWHRYVPPLRYDDFYALLAAWSMRLGHYGMARRCLCAGLSWYGPHADDLHQLAQVEAATGHADAALALLEDALRLTPRHALSQTLREELEARLGGAALPPLRDDIIGLTLEPLHDGHAAALLHQYRDPQIAVMTCLPTMASIEQVQEWVTQQTTDDSKLCCAVMHACWGLVGVVCLHRADDAGYFYFWTGCDFQGRGYGRAAATLMWHHARRLGVHTAYTSVFPDNVRSRRALDALGFEALAINAYAPDQQLLFLGKPLGERPATPQQLRALCDAIGCSIQFKPEQEVDMTTAPS